MDISEYYDERLEGEDEDPRWLCKNQGLELKNGEKNKKSVEEEDWNFPISEFGGSKKITKYPPASIQFIGKFIKLKNQPQILGSRNKE